MFNLENLNPQLNPKFNKMSQKYVMMDTQKLVTSILEKTIDGQAAFELRQIQMKKSHRGIHIVKLRLTVPYLIGSEKLYPEIVLKNSYDGRSLFEAHLGIFRVWCGNGLVITLKNFGEIKLRHMGTEEEVAFKLVSEFIKSMSQFQKVQQQLVDRELTDEEKIEFAKSAAQARWNKEFTEQQAQELLMAQRPEDEGNSLWTVYNVIQEKAIQGTKIAGMKKSKAITRAQTDLKINQDLFNLAMSYIQTDPEGNPTETEYVEFEEIQNTESFTEIQEVPDLETVTIPEQPSKFLYEGPTRRRVANPAYNTWVELYGDLV